MNHSTTIDVLDVSIPIDTSFQEGNKLPHILAGIIPVFLMCLAILCVSWPETYLGIDRFANAWFLVYCFTAINIGVVIGYIKYFPRWSFTYMGIVVLFAWYFMNVRIPPSPIFGLLSWFPVLIAFIVGASLAGSAPILALGKRMQDDWTLLVFALFNGFPLVAWIMFDEVNREFKLPFLMGIYIYGIFCVITYLLCAKPWQRILVLFLGFYIIGALSFLGSGIYWDNQVDRVVAEVEISLSRIRGSLLVGAIMTFVPFLPGLILVLVRRLGKETKAS
ncbi:hypothetical protein GF373_00050 [bacterium]|nr:hypothetical protein [bacterium]